MTRDPHYDVLFEPVKNGPVTAKNRFFQVPHCNGSGFRYPHTQAAMRGIKAEGGWAVVCTEWCTIHPSGDTTPTASARLWSEEDVRTNATLTEAVHRHGALAGCELAHPGLHSYNLYTRLPAMGPSPRPMQPRGFPAQGRAMDKADLRDMRRWHRRGVRRAIEAGYDMVYVYVGHSMTIFTDFLSPRINQRSDEYGGSIENRARLLREVMEDTKAEAGDACAVAIRLCVDEQYGSDSITAEDGQAVVEMLAEMPDLWDVNVGGYDDMLGSRFRKEGWEEPGIAFVKQLTTKPVVSVGRYTSPDRMVSLIKNGTLDMIGAARPSIADPFLPKKIEEGRPDDIRECIGCNICLASNALTVPIRCTQNPTMTEEWRRGWHPEKMPTKGSEARVLVVGGGPAGLEAARAAGARGYEVALAEASRDLGGHLNAFARLPNLNEWLRMRD
ncbi:MAG: FAD-dependent oxidoreductase [Alphaproteobacteria bacterium]